MICCKIVSDFWNTEKKLSPLLDCLAACGDFLLRDGSIFFSNTDDEKFDTKKLTKILNKYGYQNAFISPYTQANGPREDDFVNGWVTDKLIKINYTLYERQSQAAFHDIMTGLDMLDQEIQQLRQVKQNLYEEEAGGSGQREQNGTTEKARTSEERVSC